MGQVVIGAVLGAVLGAAVTYYVTTRFVHRPRLEFRLEQVGTIAPHDHGLTGVTLRLRNQNVTNLCVLELTIENKGRADIRVDDAGYPRPPNATPLPRIDFVDFEVLGINALNNSPAFWIPIAQSGRNRRLYINIHRIQSRAAARFRIIGTSLSQGQSLAASRVNFFPGAIHNVDSVGYELLGPPYLNF